MEQTKVKSVGGPLKRTGKRAEEWDSALGKAIDKLPQSQLPTTRSVLQRYRCLRIEKPDEPTINLASTIASEVKFLWDKARVPTIAPDRCYKRVIESVELWMEQRRRPQRPLLNFRLNWTNCWT